MGEDMFNHQDGIRISTTLMEHLVTLSPMVLVSLPRAATILITAPTTWFSWHTWQIRGLSMPRHGARQTSLDMEPSPHHIGLSRVRGKPKLGLQLSIRPGQGFTLSMRRR